MTILSPSAWNSLRKGWNQKGWRSQRPATSPSFYLRTPDDRDLDAITWTRATTRSVTDYQGNVWQALAGEVPWQGYRRVHNLVASTLAGWSLSGSASKAASSVLIDGEQAVRLTTAANGDGYYSTVTTTMIPAGAVVIVMLRVKAVSGSAVYRIGSDSAGAGRKNIDPNDGTLGAASGTVLFSGTVTNVDGSYTGWVGYTQPVGGSSVTVYANAAGVVDLQVQVQCARPGQTAPDEYVSNGVLSSPYHRAKVDGVKWFSTDEQGRLIDGTRGYDRDGTGAWVDSSSVTPITPGLSVDGAQTNRVTRSSDLSNAAWTKRGACTATTGYDAQVGVYSRIVGLGAVNVNDIFVYQSGFSNSVRTEIAMMLRALSTSGTVEIGNPGPSDYVGHWQVDLSMLSTTRFELITREHPAVTIVQEFQSSSTGYSGLHLRASSGTLSFDVSLVTQVEGERVQSLIYSAGSATTKNADVPSFTALPNYATNPEGTFVFDFTPKAETARQAYYVSGLLLCYKNSADDHLYQYDGTTSANYGYQVEGTRTRAATSWATGVGRYVYRDGVSQLAATAYDGAWELSTMTLVGPMLLHELSIYPSALTAIQLQALSS